ncbi:MAG: hypothetical protein RSC04_02665, partial [Bacteroidales bacterium]
MKFIYLLFLSAILCLPQCVLAHTDSAKLMEINQEMKRAYKLFSNGNYAASIASIDSTTHKIEKLIAQNPKNQWKELHTEALSIAALSKIQYDAQED